MADLAEKKGPWEAVKPNIYRRTVGKKEYEYKYRVCQKDALGNMVDTWKKADDKRQPFRTLREAEAHRKRYIEEIMARTERSMSVPNIKTLQEIFDHYVENRGNLLKPNSLQRYESNMRIHVIPYFRKQPIISITIGQIKNFIAGLRKKYAWETVSSILTAMSVVWGYAYELGIIPRETYLVYFVDKLTKVTVPKTASEKMRVYKAPEVYTPEQIEKFCSIAREEDEAYYILLQLCYYGGLRRGEALGLCWHDIDWDTGIITARRQLIYDKRDHTTYIGPLKQDVERVFPAPSSLMKILSKWKDEQAAQKSACGRKYNDHEELEDRCDPTHIKTVKGADFILRLSNGDIVTNSRANHVRERIQAITGEHFYYHALRHTIVTELVEKGVPINAISDFIGHASMRVTEDYYIGRGQKGKNILLDALKDI